MPFDQKPRQSLDDPRPASSSFNQILSKIGVDATPNALRGVFTYWSQVVGDQIASHVRPVSLQRRRLITVADHPVWATQLRFLATTVLQRFEEFVGDSIADELVVRLEKTPRPSIPPSARPGTPSHDQEGSSAGPSW